jgi:F0F1-type ATP synthase assembly protein I
MAKRTDTSNTPSDKAPQGGATKKAKKPNGFQQFIQVFQMTRRADPNAVWLMVLVFLGVTAVSLLIGFLLENWITGLIIGILLGVLGAVFILSRRAERAAYAQIEGQPGAAGAALNSLRRGWIVEEQPVAVNPRTQDVVFRAIGRPGVVLVSEGPSTRVRTLVDGERKRLLRILPNVPIHVIETGRDEGQTPLRSVAPAMNKLKPQLTKTEVAAVSKRIASLGTRLPIPKGIDPTRMRPDRRAMRGR